MGFRNKNAAVTPGKNYWAETPLDKKRQFLIETYAEAQFAGLAMPEGTSRPGDYKLAKILSMKPGQMPFKKYKAYQVQAGLVVLGFGKGLGNFGPDGCGIDGQMGKHTIKTIEKFMEKKGIRDFLEAERFIIREAQHEFLMYARKSNFVKAEKKLRGAGFGDKVVDSYRKTDFSMTRYLEWGALETDLSGDVKKDFRQLQKKYNQKVETESARLRTQKAKRAARNKKKEEVLKKRKYQSGLLTRANRGFQHSDPELRQEWKKNYRGAFNLLQDTVEESREDFTFVLKQYKKIAKKMGVDSKLVAETMRYFAAEHMHYHKENSAA